ncbi:MAG: hypothetical protein IPN53_11070 [Comamonadaceae bacterium]|nr:hypothetical protein [Comamonadaceae bacterium]
MTTPKSEKSDKSEKAVSARRRLFQIMAVGGTAAIVLPEKWVKPVVDAVIVPAHAAGSGVQRVSGYFGNRGTLVGFTSHGNVLERFADMFIGSAHAVTASSTCELGGMNVLCISVVIAPPPSTAVEVYVGGGTPGTASISSGNAITDVSVNGLTFSNLIASPSSISGFVTSSIPDCSTGTIVLPARTSNACSSGS